ncbi:MULTISPECIES: ABC transporter substrate-binding protein [unclassified Mesorhizobium]|uniref:ABC transporter substrate-binding protein n=1 Tax=unclassified Mesorhizobium TaxID=325217 RepID=UPI0003D0413B|nr:MULTISPECIES: ABC transporter substrate-binding protein [unclassified Mesorhizobium]ESZ27188.1 amino acid ABC transporter substrate-binding protein [Mesorhizobium sp. L2C084A000]RUW91356.1 amino acid ABC transporter substrate-binding protein [Mesorhizobium sp. M7A.F.Ca.US.010.02.1.1]
MIKLTRRDTIGLGLGAFFALASASTALAADTIKIGYPANLTGIQASLDGPMLNGAKLAASEINAAGGVLGQQIELVIYDSKSDSTTISTVASQLIDSDKVVGIIGFADSDSVLAIGPQVQKAQIPFITPGATSPKLPSQLGNEIFLAAFGDNVQAAVGAEFALNKLNGKTAYLLTDIGTEYTTLLSDYFVTAYEHGGGKILERDTYKIGDKTFTAQIAKLKALSPQPDFVYASSNAEEIGLILKQMRQAGINLPVVGGDGYDTPLLIQVGGDAAKDTYFTTHAYIGEGATPKVQAFIDAYTKSAGNAPENAFAALGYDSVKLMTDAIKRAGAPDPAKIRDALAATSGLDGVTGTITYRPGISVPDKSVSVIGVKDGKLVLASEAAPTFVAEP